MSTNFGDQWDYNVWIAYFGLKSVEMVKGGVGPTANQLRWGIGTGLSLFPTGMGSDEDDADLRATTGNDEDDADSQTKPNLTKPSTDRFNLFTKEEWDELNSRLEPYKKLDFDQADIDDISQRGGFSSHDGIRCDFKPGINGID